MSIVRLSQTQTRTFSCPSCGSELFKPYEEDGEIQESDCWERCWTCVGCGDCISVGSFVESDPDYGDVYEDEVIIL